MQFSLALILAVAGIAVEALPTAAPTVVFMVGVETIEMHLRLVN